MDANLLYFSVAYAIVEIENGETWGWVFNLLKVVVGRNLEQKPWTITSDMQKVKFLILMFSWFITIMNLSFFCYTFLFLYYFMFLYFLCRVL